MEFTMDMSKERKPKELFQEGESVVKVLSMDYQTAKTGMVCLNVKLNKKRPVQ